MERQEVCATCNERISITSSVPQLLEAKKKIFHIWKKINMSFSMEISTVILKLYAIVEFRFCSL